MPRICNREGCGKRIVAKDGSPDYRKHFCGSGCLKIDKRERLQAKRVKLENQRCSHCGRKPVFTAFATAGSESLSVRDASSDGRVKLHQTSGEAQHVTVEAEAGAPQSSAQKGAERDSDHIECY